VLRPMRARSAQRHLLEVAEQDVDDYGDAHKALESYGAPGAAEAARAGLALALGDGVLDSTRSAEWTRARAHLEFLQAPWLRPVRRRAPGAGRCHCRQDRRRAAGVTARSAHQMCSLGRPRLQAMAANRNQSRQQVEVGTPVALSG
jgi:hypothetical protein